MAKKKNPWEDIGASISGVGHTSTKAGGGKKAAKKRKREGKEALAAAKKAAETAKKATGKVDKYTARYYQNNPVGPSKYVASERKKGNQPYYKPSAKDAIGDQIERDIKRYNPGATNEFLAAVRDPAHDIAEAMTWIGGPEGALGKGVLKGALKIVGKDAAKTGVKAEAKAVAKAGTAKGLPKKGEEAAAKLNKAIAKKAQRAKPKKQRAIEFAKNREIASKAGRAAKKRRTINKLAWTGASAPIAGAVGGSILYNTGKALKEDPGKTLETTGHSLPSLVTGPIGTAKALAQGDIDKVVQEYKDYYEMLGVVADPTDPNASNVVKNETGLTPAITVGLLGYAGGRGGFGKRPDMDSSVPSVRTARLIDKANSGDAKAQAKLAGRRTPLSDRRGRKTVAQESRRAQDAAEAAAANDLKTGGLGRHVRNAGGKKIADVETGRTPGDAPIIKTVRVADAIPTLGKFTVALDRSTGLAQVRALIAKMEANRSPDDVTNPALLSDLDVLRAIEQNPSVLENKSLRKTLEARSKSAESNSQTRAQLAGEDGSEALKADERAQYLPMARALDVNTPEEMIPRAVEGLTSAVAKKGQDAKAAIRTEARALIRKANKKETQGKASGDDALIAEANQLRAKGKQLLGEVNRLRRADALTKLANRIDEGKSIPKKYRDLDPDELRQAAEVLRADAQRLTREHLDADAELQDAYVGNVKGAMAEGGYRDNPFYVKTGDAREYPSVPGNAATRHIDSTTREKMSEGVLAEKGLQVAGAAPFLRGIVEQRINQGQTMFARSLLENSQLTRLDPDGKPHIYTSDEFAKGLQTGEIPPGFVKMSLQEMAKHFQKGTWEEASGNLDSPFHRAIRESRGKEGNKYFAVQKGAVKEFDAQGKELGAGWKALRIVGAAQSIGLLALSPAWFVYQLAASPIVMFARHPNMLTYPAAAARMVKRYRAADKQTRDIFNGMIGSGSSNIFENLSGTPGISSSTRIVGKIADAQALARSTWGGRIVTGFTQNAKRGGPLMSVNRRYEGFIREFDAMLEIDKLIRQERHPEMHRFGRSVSQVDDYLGGLLAQLKGKTQTEVEQFFIQNGTARRELGRRIDDALGNWNALTSNEKRAATAMIFYPFLRFSLRWTTFAFPKNNPVKMAVLANIAQINTIEMEQMNGDEELGFLSDYGKVHVPGSNEVLNLARIAPASNAYVEAGLGERPPLQAALAGTQPIFGSIVSALEGVDPFTGRPLIGDEAIDSPGDFLGAVGKDMASLVTPLRPTVEPSSPYSQLLRTIRGQSTDDYKAQLIPKISIDADREMEAQRVGKLMDTAFNELKDENGYTLSKSSIAFMPSSPEKLKAIRAYNEKVSAAKELASQFEKYGIEPPEALTTKSMIDFPVGGDNKTTKEIPNRDIYLDPKKKNRWYDSGKQYSTSDSGGAIDFGGGSDALDFSSSSDAIDFG